MDKNQGFGSNFALNGLTEPALYIGLALSAAMVYGCIYF
jgi:hypothetical protein